MIDEQDIRHASLDSLRAVMGLVPQEAVLFNESIGFNIRYGKPGASQDEVVRAAKGHPDEIASMTVYVTDKQAYLDAVKEVGAAWRELLGKHYPAMALVQVADLLEDGAMVEIQAIAELR